MSRAHLSRGPYVRGPFVRGPFVRSPFVRGPFVRGTFVRGPFVRGPFVRRTFVRGPFVLESIHPFDLSTEISCFWCFESVHHVLHSCHPSFMENSLSVHVKSKSKCFKTSQHVFNNGFVVRIFRYYFWKGKPCFFSTFVMVDRNCASLVSFLIWCPTNTPSLTFSALI